MKFKCFSLILLIVIVSFIGSSLFTQDSVVYYPTDYLEPEYDNITTDDIYITNYYRIYGAITQNLYEVKESVTYDLVDINGDSIDTGVANKLIRGYKQNGFPDYIDKSGYEQYTKDFAKEREEFYKSQGLNDAETTRAVKREIKLMEEEADEPDERIENKSTIRTAVIPDYYKLIYGELYDPNSKTSYELEPAIVKVKKTKKGQKLTFQSIMTKHQKKYIITAEFMDERMNKLKGKFYTFELNKEKEQIAELTTQIEELESQIAELTAEIEKAEQELGDTSQIEELQAQIDQLTKQIEEAEQQIEEHQDNIDELEGELDTT